MSGKHQQKYHLECAVIRKQIPFNFNISLATYPNITTFLHAISEGYAIPSAIRSHGYFNHITQYVYNQQYKAERVVSLIHSLLDPFNAHSTTQSNAANNQMCPLKARITFTHTVKRHIRDQYRYNVASTHYKMNRHRDENDFASRARNERHNDITRTVGRMYNSLN